MEMRWGCIDDGHPTDTSLLQTETEDSVFELLAQFQDPLATEGVLLKRALHAQFLRRGFPGLSRGFVSLDASKPWIVFWLVQALDMLDEKLSPEEQDRVVDTLNRCQDDLHGGFGGGPGQESHLATTYAAVHALAIVGTKEAFDCIDRIRLYSWMQNLKQTDGSFIMHHGGEVDVRGSYCVASVCRLLNILTPSLTLNMGAFVASCQSYEGGIGAFPGVEGHGGYTFCGLAALEVLQETGRLDTRSLTVEFHPCYYAREWAVSRQMELEGGFQGRTNKLVDGCYSFWLGGMFPILDAIALRRDGDPGWPKDLPPFKGLLHRDALQEYILICCQANKGGLRDKPGKNPDFYHSCYCLSGLSIAQHTYVWSAEKQDFEVTDSVHVVGNARNKLSCNSDTLTTTSFTRIRALHDLAAVPTNIQVSITKTRIPRLSTLLLESMAPADAVGEITAEWIHYEPTRFSWSSRHRPDPIQRKVDAAELETSTAGEESVILYLHGGAYCIASRKTHRGITWKLAKHAHCRVLAIDYRLSPEHVFPLALHDAVSAYAYLSLPDPSTGLSRYDANKVVVMGDSAGGGLALALVLWIRDVGARLHGFKMPAGAGLMSPWLDLTLSKRSFQTNGKWDYLPDRMKGVMLHSDRTHYYIRDNSFLKHPLVSPLFAAEDPEAPICPLLIQIGECERLRDENLCFAHHKFPTARIRVEMYDSMVHVFQMFNAFLPLAEFSLERLGEFSRRVIATRTESTAQEFERKLVRVGCEAIAGAEAAGFPVTELTVGEVEAYLFVEEENLAVAILGTAVFDE
ncbi:hypothetical protein HDU98_001675 [Podochytrium sp. JEL0797]|nr:hypothetical protein HDU98_001675 [Podochytrium sp. JEL0797]